MSCRRRQRLIVYNAAGFGNDIINSFDATGGTAATQDRIDLSALGITAANFATRVIESTVGGNTLITVRDGWQHIGTSDTGDNNAIASPTSPCGCCTGVHHRRGNNIRSTAPPTPTSSTPGGNDVVNARRSTATQQDNTLNGTAGNDTIAAASRANDTINGDAGDDTIIWNANTRGLPPPTAVTSSTAARKAASVTPSSSTATPAAKTYSIYTPAGLG